MSLEQGVEKKPSTGKQKGKDTLAKTIVLEKEIERLQHEIKQKQDQLLRSLADFQNFQKRSEKERMMHVDLTKERYISEIIDIKELLQKAIADENPKDGLRLILSQMDQFFEQEHIKSLECVGKLFDHKMHYAIATVEKENCEENSIVEEIKKGYMVEGKILRPSHVIVAKKKL